MTEYEQLAKAVIGRWRPLLPDWEMLWYPKTRHDVPAVLLAPDPTKHAGYNEVPPMWNLRAELKVDAKDEENAYHLLSELTGTYGPLRTSLLDRNPPHDDLWDLCKLAINVPDGKNWKPVTRRGRLSCDIGLTLWAS